MGWGWGLVRGLPRGRDKPLGENQPPRSGVLTQVSRDNPLRGTRGAGWAGTGAPGVPTWSRGSLGVWPPGGEAGRRTAEWKMVKRGRRADVLGETRTFPLTKGQGHPVAACQAAHFYDTMHRLSRRRERRQCHPALGVDSPSSPVPVKNGISWGTQKSPPTIRVAFSTRHCSFCSLHSGKRALLVLSAACID